MSQAEDRPAAPDVARTLDERQGLIRVRYPDATFEVFEGEDAEGVSLRATVDPDDPDEVMDILVAALFAIQVKQELPVYVIPVQPRERAAAVWEAQRTHPSPVRFRLMAG